jgi:hypothetical protein
LICPFIEPLFLAIGYSIFTPVLKGCRFKQLRSSYYLFPPSFPTCHFFFHARGVPPSSGDLGSLFMLESEPLKDFLEALSVWTDLAD